MGWRTARRRHRRPPWLPGRSRSLRGPRVGDPRDARAAAGARGALWWQGWASHMEGAGARDTKGFLAYTLHPSHASQVLGRTLDSFTHTPSPHLPRSRPCHPTLIRITPTSTRPHCSHQVPKPAHCLPMTHTFHPPHPTAHAPCPSSTHPHDTPPRPCPQLTGRCLFQPDHTHRLTLCTHPRHSSHDLAAQHHSCPLTAHHH